ncbi:MAG: hypothetical protein ACT4OY_01050 [Alphaproteobacteria bacterium]
MGFVKRETNRERFFTQGEEKGNALIYVLIAIALFAALSMTLVRQTDTGEASALSSEKAELYATQLINYAAQAKSSVDQLTFSGTKIANIDFTLPTQAGFNTPPNGNKIYHPSGGGLSPGILNPEAISQDDDDPPAGWYMGRFNNVEWTASAADDVILVAYQINKTICEKINEKVTGSILIPEMDAEIREAMIDTSRHGNGNADLTTDIATGICAECDKKASLCVKSLGGEIYGFFSILADH